MEEEIINNDQNSLISENRELLETNSKNRGRSLFQPEELPQIVIKGDRGFGTVLSVILFLISGQLTH